MSGLTLKAHFDGKYITLDEPYALQPGAPLAVIVLPTPPELDNAELTQTAVTGLARAYSDDEPEYTLADVKP